MYRRCIKRIFDIIISGIALLLLSPVFLILAILVRTKLGCPVIFHQERPGYREKIFTLCKFRTMTDERDENGELLPDARRLTPFGSFLRKTSLDELPELWNIFKGDMSLIGPRPLLVGYLPYYTERERLRHTVRPGLTGLAQVSGRNFLSWDERLAKDVEYVEHLSFLMDVKVFFQTISVVFRSDDVSVDSEAVECYLWEIREKREDKSESHE
ncbi:MAG: sugar transferase [Lachnospiraceae bacterium]|nr:sugar transferase [Lachnospiraceae bacterium]MDY4068841.1 sugar transferase [Lachnospiraceae bacterium]